VTPEYSGRGRPPVPAYEGKPSTLKDLAIAAGRCACRPIMWRQGTKATKGNPTAKMRSHFLALRVRPANRHIGRAEDGTLPEVWLIAEWPPEAPEPVKYWLSNMAATTRLRTMVRLGKLRWRIEHDYRELKTGLGLDHFEGRSFLGLAPPRHPGRARSSLLQPVSPGPKSGCAGLTLYAVVRELQQMLVVMTGACHVCRRPFYHDTS
jgi:hypothetical protein